MIKFRTEVDLPGFKKKLSYRHPSLMMGSCFAENIGVYLREHSFPIVVNPFGILYNPVSVSNSLEILIRGRRFTKEDLFFSNGLYHSFSHHSRFSGVDPDQTVEGINTGITEASARLKDCSHLFITFGTSWVFKHKVSDVVVSNCHKLPASTFDRYRLSVAEILGIWVPLVEELHRINPQLQIIFTVSPIRHLKDGAHGNQLSKSTLLIAIDELCSHFSDGSVTYFPSYELVLDELRDYRFYASDMTHPSDVAIDFLREKFVATILDHEAKGVLAELEKILPVLGHKPSGLNNTSYQLLIQDQIEKTKQLQNKYPFVDLKIVIEKFSEKRAD